MGGYVIADAWPSMRVWVDPRFEIFYPPEFVARSLAAEWDPAAFQALHRAGAGDWVLAANHGAAPSFLFLARSPDWALVYWSESARIYVRVWHTRPCFHSPIAFSGPPTTLPTTCSPSHRPTRGARACGYAAELTRMLESSPGSWRAGIALALLNHLEGGKNDAVRDATFERLRTIYGADAVDSAIARIRGLPRLFESRRSAE